MLKGLFNFGGPGWFADVFNVEIVLDKLREIDDPGDPFVLPWNSWTGKCCLFLVNEVISGKIIVNSPPHRSVWHGGITVRVEEYLMGPETYGATESCALEILVLEPGYIKGETVVPFSLDLAQLEGAVWNEWYSGKLLSLRHLLIVTIERPWYTFDVSRQIVLGLQKVEPAPSTSQGETTEGVPSHVLNVLDCGGQCSFAYHIDSYNLGGDITGEIQLANLSVPVISLRILLIKVEFADGDVYESVLLEHTVVHNPNPAPLPPPEAEIKEEAGEELNEDLDQEQMMDYTNDPSVVKTSEEGVPIVGPIKENTDLSVKLQLCKVPKMTPSFISMAQVVPESEEDLCAVRYFVRLLVLTSEKLSWNTN